MATTIQVSDDVLDILKQLRAHEKADSYNTVLRRMFLETRRPKSLAGFLGKRLTRKQLLEGLRDEEE